MVCASRLIGRVEPPLRIGLACGRWGCLLSLAPAIRFLLSDGVGLRCEKPTRGEAKLSRCRKVGGSAVKMNLFHSLPRNSRCPISEASGRDVSQPVALERKWTPLNIVVPIWKRTVLNVENNHMSRRIDGISAEVCEAPLDDALIFFGTTRQAIICREFR